MLPIKHAQRYQRFVYMTCTDTRPRNISCKYNICVTFTVCYSVSRDQ